MKVYVVVGRYSNNGSYEDYNHFDEVHEVFADFEKAKEFADTFDPVAAGVFKGSAYDGYYIERRTTDYYKKVSEYTVAVEIHAPKLDDLCFCDADFLVLEKEVK